MGYDTKRVWIVLAFGFEIIAPITSVKSKWDNKQNEQVNGVQNMMKPHGFNISWNLSFLEQCYQVKLLFTNAWSLDFIITFNKTAVSFPQSWSVFTKIH